MSSGGTKLSAGDEFTNSIRSTANAFSVAIRSIADCRFAR